MFFHDLLHENTDLDDYFKILTPKNVKIFHVVNGIFINILRNLFVPFSAKSDRSGDSYTYNIVENSVKIPLLYEIQPFDNTEKVYESISGHTVENWSSETLGFGDYL